MAAFEYRPLYGQSMKVVTWNINGLRSFSPKEWTEQLTLFKADILCVQETKVSESALDESYALAEGHTAYFSCCNWRAGYSGVATFCREPDARPSDACTVLAPTSRFNASRERWESWTESTEEDSFREQARKLYGDRLKVQLDGDCLDGAKDEGRAVVTRYCVVMLDDFVVAASSSLPNIRTLAVVNVYCPHNDETRPERQEYQLRFLHRLERLIEQLMDENCLVMVVGDFNLAPAAIDVADEEQFSHRDSLARIWFAHLLAKVDRRQRSMVDTFRNCHPRAKDAFTVWNTKLGLRETNFGTRIDLVLVDSELFTCVSACYHMPEHLGSDHCPVVVTFDTNMLSFGAIGHIPELATCNWKKFASSRRQRSITSFFKPRPEKTEEEEQEPTESSASQPKKAKVTPKQQSLNCFAVYKRPPGTSTLVEAAASSSQQPASVSPVPSSSQEWQSIFANSSTASAPPLCSGHKLPAVKRKVRKAGPRQGHEFYSCPKLAAAPKGHPETRCDFFRWITPLKK